MSTTPNMNLVLPTPNMDEGTWDEKLNDALELVDGHDHTPGKGVPVPSTGIVVVDDFSMSSNVITEIAEAKFDPNSSSLSGAEHQRSVYSVGNDLFYTNGNGVAVQITDGNSLATAVASPGLPVGAVIPYAGSSAPSGWLLADGSAVSRTTYSALFAVIGVTYGTGDGSTTFNLPGMNGRTAIGSGTYNDPNAGLITRTLGQTLGEAFHLLDVDEMPNHNHTDTGHSHNVTVSGPSPGANTANYRGPDSGAFQVLTTTTGFASLTATGGGEAHNNMQPSLVLSYIIKT